MVSFSADLTILTVERCGKWSVKTVPANSLIRAFVDICGANFIQSGVAGSLAWALPNLSNVARNIYVGTIHQMFSGALVGDSTYGIVVGTGTNPVTVADYVLQAQIVHGSGAGQLQYSSMAWLAPVTDGTSRVFTQTRSFYNATANPITINEVGIYAYQRITSGASDIFMIDRTLSTTTVNPAATKVLTYSFKATV